MRVAVTGASGFVGGYIARWLSERGHHVTSFGRRDASRLRASLPDYRVWDLAQALQKGPVVEAVVHAAAHVGDWGAEREFQAVNVLGTSAVLSAFPSARVVHISTSSVYSDHVRKSGVREDAHTGACVHSAYARTKAQSERLVLSAASTNAVLRPHIVYGPGDTTLLPRLLASQRFGRILVPGDGRNELSVTHVENLAAATELALGAPGAPGVFNIADAETTTVDELLRTVLARIGSRARLMYLARPAAASLAAVCEYGWRTFGLAGAPPLTRYVVAQLTEEHTLDIARARVALGYTPRWTFRDGPLGE